MNESLPSFADDALIRLLGKARQSFDLLFDSLLHEWKDLLNQKQQELEGKYEFTCSHHRCLHCRNVLTSNAPHLRHHRRTRSPPHRMSADGSGPNTQDILSQGDALSAAAEITPQQLYSKNSVRASGIFSRNSLVSKRYVYPSSTGGVPIETPVSSASNQVVTNTTLINDVHPSIEVLVSSTPCPSKVIRTDICRPSNDIYTTDVNVIDNDANHENEEILQTQIKKSNSKIDSSPLLRQLSNLSRNPVPSPIRFDSRRCSKFIHLSNERQRAVCTTGGKYSLVYLQVDKIKPDDRFTFAFHCVPNQFILVPHYFRSLENQAISSELPCFIGGHKGIYTSDCHYHVSTQGVYTVVMDSGQIRLCCHNAAIQLPDEPCLAFFFGGDKNVTITLLNSHTTMEGTGA